MFLGDLVGVLRRRWLLAVACLVLVLAATGFMVSRSQPTYSYSSSYLLLPPTVSRVTDPAVPDYTHGNPLFFLSALNQTRDILIGAMTSEETQAEMAKNYAGVGYTVTPDVLGSGPVIVIATQSTSDAAAAGASEALAKVVPARLSELQSSVGVGETAMITISRITHDTQPTISHKQQIRSGIMTFGGLGLLALFFVGVVDALLVARANRRKRDADADTEPDGTDDDDTDREVDDEVEVEEADDVADDVADGEGDGGDDQDGSRDAGPEAAADDGDEGHDDHDDGLDDGVVSAGGVRV